MHSVLMPTLSMLIINGAKLRSSKQENMSRAFIVLLALTGSLTLTPASMIDPDTPSVARGIGSASGLLGEGPEGYQLVSGAICQQVHFVSSHCCCCCTRLLCLSSLTHVAHGIPSG